MPCGPVELVDFLYCLRQYQANVSTEKGFLETYWYSYNNGANIVLSCEDWDKETNIVDVLALSINSSELQNFFNNKAYK